MSHNMNHGHHGQQHVCAMYFHTAILLNRRDGKDPDMMELCLDPDESSYVWIRMKKVQVSNFDQQLRHTKELHAS